jgi:hypothetical protein
MASLSFPASEAKDDNTSDDEDEDQDSPAAVAKLAAKMRGLRETMRIYDQNIADAQHARDEERKRAEVLAAQKVDDELAAIAARVAAQPVPSSQLNSQDLEEMVGGAIVFIPVQHKK